MEPLSTGSSETPAAQPLRPVLTGDGRLARFVCLMHLTGLGVWAHRYQLLLTVVTMAVGSLALALTIFVGDGALHRVWEDMEQLLGSWVVAYDDAGTDDTLMRKRGRKDFTEEDLATVRRRLPDARLVTPVYFNALNVRFRERQVKMPIDAITPALGREALYRPVRGAALSEAAYQGLAPECLLSESAMEVLGVPLERHPTVLVDDKAFQVVGVTADPPRVSSRNQPRVILPYVQARLNWIYPGSVGHILVSWWSVDDMDSVMTGLREALEEARGPQTYVLSSSQLQIRRGKQVVSQFMLIGLAQALFCILVATVGVLNVMLTNVTRRSHEYAVRLSMGASQKEILLSVLLESVALGLAGALLGILAAIAVAPTVCALLSKQIPGAVLLEPVIAGRGILLPFVICGLAALFAGILPALRVRKIDVLASLRAAG